MKMSSFIQTMREKFSAPKKPRKRTAATKMGSASPHSLVKKATIYLWKHSLWQFLGISAVIAFLLFFLHLFITGIYLTDKVSGDVTQKLGFYFYITDPGKLIDGKTYTAEEISDRVMSMKDELTVKGLTVEYYSKEDALNLLQERIPGVIQNFDKYGIANPLPATMYVMFDNNEQFLALSGIVQNYTDVVRNYESIQTKGGFSEQQQRISNIINITHFSIVFSVILMIVVIVMIVSFLLLIITMKCRQFRKNIEVEKLLGANYLSIKMPFLISIVIMLILGFIMTGLILLIIGNYIGTSFSYLFNTSFGSYISSLGRARMILIVIVEFVALAGAATLISDRVLTSMIRKI